MQLLISFLPLTFLLTIAHPFYVTLSEINHNEKEKTLEITVKIFSDDLTVALEALNTTNATLGENLESEEADALLKDYLDKHFQIDIYGDPVQINYLGKEVEMDATWVYLEVTDVHQAKEITVRNTLLTEYHDNQTNIVHLFINGNKKSMLFSKNFVEDKVTF